MSKTDTKTTQRERPPTASQAKQWYTNGYIDDEGLDQLVESAVNHYGDDGDPEFTTVDGIEMRERKAEGIKKAQAKSKQTPGPNIDWRNVLDETFKALVWMVVGYALSTLAYAAAQPAPGTIPL